MPQSFVQIYVHIIFSTKHRDPILTKEIQPRVFSYLCGALKNLECPCQIVGGHIDHIHALCRLNKNMKIPQLIEEMKTESSKWMKKQGNQFGNFHWQSGYGAFSVSPTNVDKVRRYIENQEKHHRTMTFQEEFLMFLKEYGVEYDERYIWD